MRKETLFGGDWQKVLIKVVLLLLVLLLIYGAGKKILAMIKKGQERSEKEDLLVEQENNPPSVVDDSTPNDPDTISDTDAMDIANKLEIAMTGWGTDNDMMFNLLECLNGASLQKVKFEFGIRDYDGDTEKPFDLFDWFGQELESGIFATQVYWSDCVANCDGYWSQCYEGYYMREIWSKSGLPLTF